MRTLLTFVSFLILPAAACKKTDDSIQASLLAGTWQEQETSGTFAGTTYTTTFRNDGSFQTVLSRYTDALIPDDSCASNHRDYVKGNYTVSGNIISFSGSYCDELFLNSRPGCNDQTVYSEQFVSSLNGNELVMGVGAQNEWGKIKMKRN
jgi:hypothetical protein